MRIIATAITKAADDHRSIRVSFEDEGNIETHTIGDDGIGWERAYAIVRTLQKLNNKMDELQIEAASGDGFAGVSDSVEDQLESTYELQTSLTRELASLSRRADDAVSMAFGEFTKLGALDGRLQRKGNHIMIDYEKIDPVLETKILEMLDNSDNLKDAENTAFDGSLDGGVQYVGWTALVNFIDKLYANTTEYVRDQLFTWLAACGNSSEKGFTIAKDGDLIGYKGVRVAELVELDESNAASGSSSTNAEDTELTHYESINTGFAIVNGDEYNGHIPNNIGDIVEMPRKMVTDDPNIGCSAGLHVGVWDYARGWGNGVVETVKFSPADVVSIPIDCSAQKLRTCRYQVINVVNNPIKESFYDDESDDKYDDYEDDDYEDDDMDDEEF